MSEYYNGAGNQPCLKHEDFQEFVNNRWEPHTEQIGVTMERVADAMESLKSVLTWAVKLFGGLFALLILINAATQIVQLVQNSNTSFKGTIGGPDGATIEIQKADQSVGKK